MDLNQQIFQENPKGMTFMHAPIEKLQKGHTEWTSI